MNKDKIIKAIKNLVAAIVKEDFAVVKEIFDQNIDNSVTDKSGNVFHIIGSDAYINAIKKMNFSKIKPSLTITQINVLNNSEALFYA